VIDSSSSVVAEVLVARAAPASVAIIGGAADRLAAAFTDRGVGDVRVIDTDLRSEFSVVPRVDLAVCIGAGEHSPADVAPVLVEGLCASADVVAFAAALPGLVPSAANARWPAWWDALFESNGYVVHDIVRPDLWLDDRVDVRVRQSLVLYAAPGRFEPVAFPLEASRTLVHPEAHQRSMELAERRDRLHIAAANLRAVELDAEIGRLDELVRQLSIEFDESKARVSSMTGLEVEGLIALETQLLGVEHAARDARSDALLLQAALVAAQRDLVAASYRVVPSMTALRQRPKWYAARVASTIVPLRKAFKRRIGPAAPLFDKSFYLRRYPDVADSVLSPLWHYRRHGVRGGRSPHPFFDPAWYKQRYDDVPSGVDPAHDYLVDGWRRGHDPHPAFLAEWYATRQSLDGWRRSPLEHYLEVGRTQGASPHPLIDAEWYLRNNPDVATSGVNAVDHYLGVGWRQGRQPHPLFDVRWYLDTYPHVASEGLDPLIDYLGVGWREHRDPHPLFDVAWYLEQYPDVVASGLDPLTHYVLRGADEGRATSRVFDTGWYVAAHPEAASEGRGPLEYCASVGSARGDVGSASGRGASDVEERFRV